FVRWRSTWARPSPRGNPLGGKIEPHSWPDCRRGTDAMSAADDEQPWVDSWPMFDEARSKFPAPVDIDAARVRLARRFNSRPLPKKIEVDLAWERHRKR